MSAYNKLEHNKLVSLMQVSLNTVPALLSDSLTVRMEDWIRIISLTQSCAAPLSRVFLQNHSSGGPHPLGFQEGNVKEQLTCTHACFIPRLIFWVVTVEPFVGITDVCFIAGLSCLLGTDLAAATAILHQADPGGAGWHRRALARPAANLLALHFTCFWRLISRLLWRAVEKLTHGGLFWALNALGVAEIAQNEVKMEKIQVAWRYVTFLISRDKVREAVRVR